MNSVPLAIADNYHIGLVVPDIASATERLTAVSGYGWTKPVEASLSVVTADGEFEMPFSFVYSIEAPHLEVIQEVPGTIWTASTSGAAHHLGYWVDDLPLAAAGLEAAGFVLEARPSGDELSTFAYFLDPAGVRIEIVDRALFPDWAGFLETMKA
jgi:catechol 2,3-dioxygenase-like lactoylglutathione lyase family enzyme